jgi:dihydropteroate synthase
MTQRFYLRPLVSLGTAEDGGARHPLAGGPLGFERCEVVLREGPRIVARELVPPAQVPAWVARCAPELVQKAEVRLATVQAPREAFAGLAMDRPQIMGVINVTPDSFSDGGDRFERARAIDDGLAMVAAGAAALDVGGESTRPGAEPVSEAEELRRVIPVIQALAGQAVITIDTRHARVMAEALAAGADGVNDVTALTGDPQALGTVAQAQAPAVLMHMQGEPRFMQVDPHYDDAALDVYDYLAARVAACEAAGLQRSQIAVDPGIGFGKNDGHNLRLLDHLALFHGLGCPILLGVSRKSFIGRLSRDEAPKERLPGSLAAALAGLARGAQILRVHDVPETRQAVAIWQAIAADDPRAARL